MNQQIKECVEQAGITKFISEDRILGPKIEKFAELIVQECIVDFYRNYLDITSDEDITVQVDRYVKEHFGVE